MVFGRLFGGGKKVGNAPPVQGFSGTIDGFKQFDISPGGAFTFNRTPFQRNQLNQFQGLFDRVFPTLAVDNLDRNSRLDKFERVARERLQRPLEESFQDASNAARDNFNARGLSDSTGFADFHANELFKQFREGTSANANQAFLQRNDLFDREQQQQLNLLNLANSGVQQDLSNQLAFGQFGLQGFGQVNAAHQNRFRNQIAATQIDNQPSGFQLLARQFGSGLLGSLTPAPHSLFALGIGGRR
jgi:hypothetical protein